jgi:hypothetical protein
MRHILGVMLGIGAGYVAAMVIATFVSARDVASASLLLMLTCCGVGGVFGLICTAK